MANLQNPGDVCVEVHGKTLREALPHMSLADRLQLLPAFLNLCRVVGAAHARGTVHRGLHPGQILVTDTGDMIVMDWSLSKQRGRQDPHEQHFQQAVAQFKRGEEPSIPLDPACLAPEIILDHMEDVDAHSDVYSLGAILYEILAGRPLYGGAPSEVLDKALAGGWRAVSDYEPDAPAELVEVYRRALSREPSARFANARLMARELRLLFEETGPGTGHAPVSPDVASYKRVLWLCAAVVVVLLVVFGVVLQHFARRCAAASESMQTIARAQREDQQRSEERIRLLNEDIRAAQMERDREHDARVQAQQEAQIAKEELDKLKAASSSPAGANAAEAATSAPDTTGQTEPAAGTPTAPGTTPTADTPVSENEPLPEPQPGEVSPAPGAPEDDASAEVIAELTQALKEAELEGGAKGLVVEGENGQLPERLEATGLKVGDVITQVNRTPVISVGDVKEAVGRAKREASVSLRIVRDGQARWTRISLGRPAPAPEPPPAVEQPPAKEDVPAGKDVPSEPPPDAGDAQEAAPGNDNS